MLTAGAVMPDGRCHPLFSSYLLRAYLNYRKVALNSACYFLAFLPDAVAVEAVYDDYPVIFFVAHNWLGVPIGQDGCF